MAVSFDVMDCRLDASSVHRVRIECADTLDMFEPIESLNWLEHVARSAIRGDIHVVSFFGSIGLRFETPGMPSWAAAGGEGGGDGCAAAASPSFGSPLSSPFSSNVPSTCSRTFDMKGQDDRRRPVDGLLPGLITAPGSFRLSSPGLADRIARPSAFMTAGMVTKSAPDALGIWL